jgi:broad specificity phosphatase PhoE
MDSLYREMDNCSRPNNNVFIISHGLFMRLFLTRFFRWTVEKFHTLENFDNCGYCILERDDPDGSYKLKTELRTYPNHKPIETSDLKEAFDEESFEAEVNPTHAEDIGHNEEKDD